MYRYAMADVLSKLLYFVRFTLLHFRISTSVCETQLLKTGSSFALYVDISVVIVLDVEAVDQI